MIESLEGIVGDWLRSAVVEQHFRQVNVQKVLVGEELVQLLLKLVGIGLNYTCQLDDFFDF